MTIEFHCNSCHALVRTPDGVAGKKGKCPECGAVVDIPASPVPQRTSEAKIEFHCSSCGKRVRVPATAAGKKGKCPQCGGVVQIPAESSSTARSAWRETTSASPPGGEPAGKIQFACGTCGKSVQVPASLGGQMGKCPYCASIMQIPAASAAGLTPLGQELGPTGGLTPLGGAQAGGGYDPFGDLGSLPQAGDPLASPQAGGSPFGNPYASPMPSTAYAPARKRSPKERVQLIVMLPAIFLLGNAVLATLYLLVNLGFILLGSGMAQIQDQLQRQGGNPDALKAAYIGAIVGVIIAFVVGFTVVGLTILGSIQMMRMKSWGWGLTACILSMVPCSYFCLLGIPLGIWGIVVLSLADVKRAFRRR